MCQPPLGRRSCEVVASTDGASAHTAHCLSITQMSCVLTTIYCNYSVAAGACPTESMEVAETNQTAHTGYQTSPDIELKTSIDYNTGLASTTNNEPQTKVARHPGIPVSIVHSPRSIPFQSLYLQTTDLTQRSSPEGLLVHVPD